MTLEVVAPEEGTIDPDALAARVPPIGDKAIVDLVNGIQINRELISYRRRRGFFGRLLDAIAGGGARDVLFDGNILAGQEALFSLMLEVQDRLRVSDVALRATQRVLLETRSVVREVVEVAQRHDDAIAAFQRRLGQVEQRLRERIAGIDERLRAVELRVAAHEAFEIAVEGWRAERTYAGLPPLARTALLAREIFSGPVGRAMHEVHDAPDFRRRLVDVVEVELRRELSVDVGVADVADETWRGAQADDRALLAEMLDVRELPPRTVESMPLHFVLGTTWELAALRREPLTRPGAAALELCRERVARLPHVMARRELVEGLVTERAGQLLDLRARVGRAR